MAARVSTAAQAAALDQRTIQEGTASYALMERAGAAAAQLLLERAPELGIGGALVFTGSGNNGGDGWVVARVLRAAGVEVAVRAVVAAATDDARRAAEGFQALGGSSLPAVAAPGGPTAPGVVIDALLGTGARGAPRGEIAAAIDEIAALRRAGCRVVSLDIPSGIDATTGTAAGAAVSADLTLTFGTIKRGLLANRDAAGAIVALDIGVVDPARDSALPRLVDAPTAAKRVPRIGANAHKGSRKKIVIVGGARGMAGAVMLAARGAHRSGVGMVRLCVAPESVEAVQAGEPAATAAAWPESDDDLRALADFADAMLIGPGLGTSDEAPRLVGRLLATFAGPVVLDADALNLHAGRLHALRSALQDAHAARGPRAAVLTPHPVELARLAGVAPGEVHARRYEMAGETARSSGATVLVKGVPTIVSDGASTEVVAAGTPVLATAGSGDVLGGIITTLLAQSGEPQQSATLGAWVHGRAAEIAGRGRIRGVTLDDVLDALADAWPRESTAPASPVLAELPAIPR